MRTLRAWLVRFGSLFGDRDRNLDEELQSHLELDTDDGVRSGLSPEEARRRAVLRLGGIDAAKERYRDRRGIPAIETIARDLRYAVRALVRRPAFALAGIVVLALGIGANTAIFSVVHAVLLKPLPYPDPDRLVFVWQTAPPASFPGISHFAVSPANFLDWEAQSHSFERMAIIHFRPFNITGGSRPETLRGARVSSGFFPVLGSEPLLGRTFLPDEDQPGRGQVIVLSERLWARRFGRDPAIVGRTIALDGHPYTVVGVMDDSVRLPDWAELWTPMAWTPAERAVRGNHNCTVIARLRSGVDLSQAHAELSTISRRLEQQYPEDNKGWGAVPVPMHENLVQDIRTPLLVLLGAVAFVLLIACANVANLVLARTIARRKEIGVRLALGASGGRVLRQIVCETMLLGLAGGIVGLLVARAGVDVIVAFLGDALPNSARIDLDLPVLGFTFVVGMVAGAAAGLASGWRIARTNVSDAMKQGLGHLDADAAGGRTRTILIVAEVALSLVLLVGAGLMIRSLWSLSRVDPGLDPSNVLTARMVIPSEKYGTAEAQMRFYTDVLDRVRRVPGVETLAMADTLPMEGDANNWPIAVEGRPAGVSAEHPEVQVIVASPGFFRTMRIPIVQGRDFTEADIKGRPPVAVITEAMARHFWPNENPIGRRLTSVVLPDTVLEVVGVVRDIKLDGLDASRPVEAMYLPFAQGPRTHMALVARTTSSPLAIVPSVARIVQAVDPEQPLVEVRTMEEIVWGSMAQRRFTMLLLASFAALALVLAAVGIYSVLSYTVRQRVREIGIRLALGARPSEVLQMIVGRGLRPTLAGIGIGLFGAAALSRLLSSSVYGVSGTDPVTFASVAVLLVTVGVCASLVPAYRATQVDPIRTLREE